MSLEQRGVAASHSEVTNISFWLLVDNQEYYAPFADYPVFKKATYDLNLILCMELLLL